MDPELAKQQIDQMDERGWMFNRFHSRTLYFISQGGPGTWGLGLAGKGKGRQECPDGPYGFGDLTAVITSI